MLRILLIGLLVLLSRSGVDAVQPTHNPDSVSQTIYHDTLDADTPTVIGFFITTQEEVDADTSEGLSSALDDFQYYLSAASGSLKRHGISVLATNDCIVVVRGTDRKVTYFNLLSDDSLGVGYWFFRPGAKPKYLAGGVRVDMDLLEQAALYFPNWRREQ